MRKFILIAALVLASASAQAAGMRGLILASSEEQATADPSKPVEAPKPVETPKAVDDAKPGETPKYVDRPAAVNTATDTPKTDAVKPVAVPAPKAERRKPRRDWTEARIIGELHRHGIYW
jgi:outer membrane biosynthesis protein TonB